MGLEQFQMDEISFEPNFISCLGIRQENASNTMQNLHYFTVALSWFNTYGVFKYDYCILKTLFFGLVYSLAPSVPASTFKILLQGLELSCSFSSLKWL